MDDRQHQANFERGIELFNARRFFDAHEVWEEIWLHSSEPEKTYLQGIIQIAAAFHHYLRGNLKGTRSLLRAGLGRLEPCSNVFRGFALHALRDAAAEWADLLTEEKDAGTARVPQVRRGVREEQKRVEKKRGLR